MAEKKDKQATTAADAAEPAAKKTTATKKAADNTAVKVAKTAAKVAEAAAKVAEAAALIAESAKAEKAAKPKAAAKKPATKEVGEEVVAVLIKEVKPVAKKTPAKKPAVKEPDEEVVAVLVKEPKPAAKKAEKEIAATAVKEPKPKAEAKKPAAKQQAEKKYSLGGRYRLYARLREEIIPALVKERGYNNVNEAPKVDKIVLNMRLGDVKDNAKSVQTAIAELAQIAGQKPIACKAKKSVANFKVREGMVIGAKVTLRGLRAYEFLDKLISIALPRVRDFRGVSGKAFDGRGNYALGVKEQIIFPEISYELVEKLRGFDIAIITTAKTDDEAKALLTKMGMPFRN